MPGKEPQEAALSIVSYEKAFQAKVKFDFKIEPAELDICVIERNQILYAKANHALINVKAMPSFNVDDYGAVDERMGDILQRLESDPKLRKVMAEFLNHYREFYQKTNIILDAMGYENILFYQDENEEWQFKIGSVIKHDTGQYTQELFDSLHANKAVDLNTFVNFTHAYFSPANIRAVNVCAMKLGLEPVIADIAIHQQDLLKIAQELPIGERMLAYARHGDFKQVEQILEENKEKLNFNLRDFWVYPMIAEEFIKHGQPAKTYKNFLDIVCQFPMVLPENNEDKKRIQDVKTGMIDRKHVQDRKMVLHNDLGSFITQFFKKQLQAARPENEPSFSISNTI